MNKWIIRGLIFLGYSIPYVYLAMNDDINNQSMLCYGVMLMALIVLISISTKTHNGIILLVGNLSSFMISYLLMMNHQTGDWSWYFKPFSAIGLLVFVSGIVWVIQIIYFTYHEFKYLKLNKKL